jgi:hypothetical protein
MGPAIGYRRVKKHLRPTYKGSAAEAYDLAHGEEDSSDDSSPSDSEEAKEDFESEEVGMAEPAAKRSKKSNSKSSAPKETLQTVVAIFGKGVNGNPELWLAIDLHGKVKSKVRVKFLEAVAAEPGMYILISQTQFFNCEAIERSFADIPFISKREGRTTDTRLKSPFDSAVLQELEAQCAASQAD